MKQTALKEVKAVTRICFSFLRVKTSYAPRTSLHIYVLRVLAAMCSRLVTSFSPLGFESFHSTHIVHTYILCILLLYA